MTFTITLHDGSEHAAQFNTLTAVMPLLNLFLDGENLSTPTSSDAAARMLPRLLSGLSDADFIKDLANGLLTLFPTLPRDRVWFNDASRPTPYGIAGLEVTEIFLIVARCLESANKLDTAKLEGYIKEMNPGANKALPVTVKALKTQSRSRKR